MTKGKFETRFVKLKLHRKYNRMSIMVGRFCSENRIIAIDYDHVKTI